MATTCLQQPLFWGPVFLIYSVKLPLNNDHLSTNTTIFWVVVILRNDCMLFTHTKKLFEMSHIKKIERNKKGSF